MVGKMKKGEKDLIVLKEKIFFGFGFFDLDDELGPTEQVSFTGGDFGAAFSIVGAVA